MQNEENKQLNHKRRHFLKSFGVISASLSGVGFANAAGDHDYVKIPGKASKGEILTWKKVPREWNSQRERANRVVDNLAIQLSGHSNVARVALTTTDKKIEHWKLLKAQVEVHDLSGGPILPQKIDGIEVGVEKAKEKHLTTHADEVGTGCENRSDFRNIPGGVQHEGASGGYRKGTTTCKVKKDGSYYMLAAAHVFGECTDSLGSNPAYQRQKQYGDIHIYNQGHDWVLVERTDSYFSLDGTILFPGSRGRVVVGGYHSKSSIQEMMSNDTSVKKMGISTGESTGTIESISSDEYGSNPEPGRECVSFDSDGVRITNNQAQGDSGAPVFEFTGGNAFMVSIASLGVNGQAGQGYACENAFVYEQAEGWPAYRLWNDHNIVFNTHIH